MCCAAGGDAGEVVRKEAIARAAGGFDDFGVADTSSGQTNDEVLE